MATIDLIVLGMLKNKSMSAYDIQKLVEYRNISKWVKISTPSIYKKVIQLEGKGLVSSTTVQGENLADKVIYSLTDAGNKELEKLMNEISNEPIRFFLDFNAVIVNIECIPPEQQRQCIANIEKNIKILKDQLEENRNEKEDRDEIPKTGLDVLEQQYILAKSIETWIQSVKNRIN
ncbi:PadR family transcriptional regulator [Hespellia stercorisuis]|uniref:Transcriptional regulator PadR-like family protein n=1 Tax=Hespellia stercorisuis DSM 15480 TaxID=1121950 RepID=A0A1M6M905_9FIRM|nr:PadR family transcriptional regulator [Hespellia stercorisuis]SHJ79987.1 Transcriptional regulator PadR-like family protein [Hespellia stercorisuis DSM 15480]